MTNKTKTILSWVLAGLLAFAFAGAGASKLLGAEMQLKNLETWGYPLWMRFPIGLSELVLAVGLLLPKFRTFAAYAVYPWALVAIYTHLQAGQPASSLGGAFIFAALATALLLVLRAKTKPVTA